jgi:hypothetical protein
LILLLSFWRAFVLHPHQISISLGALFFPVSNSRTIRHPVNVALSTLSSLALACCRLELIESTVFFAACLYGRSYV